jgi:hypothetical protein
MMGTRADFYLGRGRRAKWIGSIAWDGYPDGISEVVLKANSKPNFKAAFEDWAKREHEDDFTSPKEGWPWPWDDSHTTDYAYAFDKGKVWASCFGSEWFDPLDKDVDYDALKDKAAVFPNMKKVKKVTLGRRSGVITISPK